MDFVDAQKEVKAWRAKNFRDENRPTLLGQMAGATGEAAEGMQMALKWSDRRISLWSDTKFGVMDAIGDTLIYLMGACDLLDTTLDECFELAWGQVKDRTLENWDKDDGYKRDVARAKAEGYDWS